MKETWSTKLFLRINKFQGTYPWLDTLVGLLAFYLIFFLAAGVLVYSYYFYKDAPNAFVSFWIFLGIVFFVAIIASYITAWILKDPRPAVSMKQVHQLYKPIMSWKSFPSDHTIAAFILAEGLLYIGAPWFAWCVGLFVAFCVGFARVYAGFHYPRDIVGGIVYASIASYIVFTLLFPL